jgi:predicted pyridoxine 5'-phosphate oxidase superfamily flavin-nucleotide-binding protein
VDTVIDEDLRAFLERGCATVVGTADADGTPHAQRAFGCSVIDPITIRVLLDDTDPILRAHLDARSRIAITSADVRTLRSVQLKGRVLGVEDTPTADDIARCEAHNEELFRDIEEADHFPREYPERMVPPGYVVAVVAVEELYDQTPGPGAGAAVTTGPAP